MFDESRYPLHRVPLPWSFLTWILTAIVLGLFGLLNLLTLLATPVDSLREPERVLKRVYGAELDAAAAWDGYPRWRLPITAITPPVEASIRREAILHHEQFVEGYVSEDSTRLALAVLLAEDGRIGDAREHLADIKEGSRLDAVREAYGIDGRPGTRPAPSFESDWVTDRVAQRLAERRGVPDRAEAAKRATVERGGAILERGVAMELTLAATCAAGVLLVIVFIARRCRPVIVAEALVVAPWPGPRAHDVLIRGLVIGIVIGVVAYLVLVRRAQPLVIAADSLIFLGMIAFSARYLHHSWGLGVASSLGLTLRPAATPKLALATIALIAIEQMIVMGVMWASAAAGFESSSLEGVIEEGILGSEVERGVVFVAAVILAPLFEEILFRGMLFPSLRRRFGLWTAAALSSVLFAVVHLYSVPALAAISLGAIASCVAYEKTRSLWPCILAHAANNLLAYLGMIYFYA